jgi:hypothetical protein
MHGHVASQIQDRRRTDPSRQSARDGRLRVDYRAGCLFDPGIVPLEPMTSTLEGTAGAFKLKFAPTTGTTAITLNISGIGCPIAGSIEIKGKMSCNYPGVESETKNHVLEFSLSSGTELKFGGKNVTLTGKDEFWLASNENWKVA